MIEANPRRSFSALVQALRARGERIAAAHAYARSAASGQSGHPWRSAQRLWPDIFEED